MDKKFILKQMPTFHSFPLIVSYMYKEVIHFMHK